MHLYLIRHWQTEENKYNIIAWQTDWTLSDVWKKQAQLVSHVFESKQIDYVYCSDLWRVKDTAAPTLRWHPDVICTFDPRLRERDQWVLTGKSKDDIKKEFWQELDVVRASHPSVESKEDMNLRMKNVFDEIIQKHQHSDDVVLVFSHHAFLHVTIKYFHQIYFATKLIPERIENASITHYIIHADWAEIVMENDTSHLS